MVNRLIPIYMFERDRFLQAFHPELAGIVRAWRRWYNEPSGHPPYDTVDLIALCRHVLSSMFVMWPSAMDYYGLTPEELR